MISTAYSQAVFGNDVRYRLADMPTAEEAGMGGFAFHLKDLIDVINPFQQLPIISTLYREETGETISAGSRLAGGYLFGGPIGLAMAAINSGIDALTGSDIGEHMYAMIAGSGDHQYAMNAYRKTQALG